MEIKYEQLIAHLLDILPDASFEQDNGAQLVVYTGLYPKPGVKDVWKTQEETQE